MKTDYAAARVHRRNANRHYDEADRFRQLNLPLAAQAAMEAGRWEDRIAELLSDATPDDEEGTRHVH
jgi:hypothetical protein